MSTPLPAQFDWMSQVCDPTQDFISMVGYAWSDTGGAKPIIDDIMDYRSLDPKNKEYVLIHLLDESDDFQGIGNNDFRRDAVLTCTVKTGVSDYRARQIVEECRRIFRNRNNWGSWTNVRLSKNVAMLDERQVYVYQFTIVTYRLEHTDTF